MPYSLVKMHHNLFNHFPNGRHLACFQVLPYIIKNLFLYLMGKVKEYMPFDLKR